MSDKGKSKLDELLDEDADKRAALPDFKKTDWARLSGTDFAHERQRVFAEQRRVAKLERLADEVRQADREAEAAKRRADEDE